MNLSIDSINVWTILRPLISAGLGTAPLTNVQELLSHEITVFKDRVRIDVQTSTGLRPTPILG